MQPHALEQRRQRAFGQDRRGLRPAAAHRVLQRAFEHHLHEQQHDEVQQQRGDDLVDAEPRAQQRRDEHQHGARERAGRHDQRNEQTGRRLDRACADRDGRERAGIELALGADIVELGAECDRGGQAGEDQRRRARQRLGEGEQRTRRAVRHQAERADQRRPGDAERDRGEQQRGRDRADLRAEPQRERRARARLEADHAASAWPAIIRPSCSRVTALDRARPREAAARHHGDAVGQREQFVEVLRDEHDRDAALARLEQAPMHLGGRADIEAAGRLVRQHHARARSNTRARITFWMLPPDSSRIAASGPGQRTS